AQIADPSVSKEQSHEVHHRLGQNEMREGRSLDTLQSAYRVGARVSWRRIMRVGRRAGLSSTVMSQLADAMLAFMDELASLAPDVLAELDGVEPKVVVPGEIGSVRLTTLQAALPDCRLSIGPCVPLGSAADSLRWARNALVLAERGVLTPRRVIRAEEHL